MLYILPGLQTSSYRVMVYHTRAQCLGRHTVLPYPAGCVQKGKEDMAVRTPDLAARCLGAGEEFFDLTGFGFPAADQKFAVHHQGRGGHNSQFDDLYQIFHLLHGGFHPQVAQGFLGVFI